MIKELLPVALRGIAGAIYLTFREGKEITGAAKIYFAKKSNVNR